MPCDLERLRRRLAEIVGGERLLDGAAAASAVDGVAPRLVVHPGTQDEVGAVVAACMSAGAAIAARGGGTALGLGNPPARLDVGIRLDRLARIVEFDAENLVVTAEAGVRLAELERLLGTRRQFLPLDPARMDRRTVGGVLATNASGPSRLLYGTARDLLLGMRVVLGTGERIRCGGRVIKNVSGYDLNKLFIGSLGTLGVITEATFRLWPMPAARATVAGAFPDLPHAAAVVARCLQSCLLPEAMELLDAQAMQAAPRLALGHAAGYGLAVSLAGSPEAVERQRRDFTRFFTEGGAGAISTLDAAESPAAWREIRDLLEGTIGAPERLRLKLAVPIAETPAFLARTEALLRGRQWRGRVAAHAGSGVVRAVGEVPEGTPPDAVRDGVEALRGEAEAAGGSLVVEAAAPALKRRLDAWGTPGGGFSAMRRLKAEFDPAGGMNPGRFLGGI